MVTLISVLMTVYNGRQYLAQAVDSVLAQSYSDFEFLIVDDASADESLKIIKAYQDPRIRIIENSFNQGQTVSLNIGLSKAQGEYIARIDADDIAFPHWLKSQVDFLKNNGKIDVLSVGLLTFDTKGLGKAYFSPSCREDILLKAIIKSPINHGGVLMKKNAILNVGGYNSNYKIAADYGVWVSLLRQNALIKSNPDIVMAIRRHNESESEKNKLTLALMEIAEISRQHGQFLTGMDLTKEDGLLMCRAHYDEAGLNREDFLKAIEIHKNVYACLRQDLNLNKARVKFWYKKQARTFFLRRIYWHILCHNQLGVRLDAWECLKKTGFSIVFAGLYFFSYFPQLFLDFILKSYYFVHAVIAKTYLGIKRINDTRRRLRG
ncbi:MAG: glycosyltransferase [Candidatus Omnitrophota bacterium]|nr:glycosyltransferase [Candidatus Omnitrophota bacterium]